MSLAKCGGYACPFSHSWWGVVTTKKPLALLVLHELLPLPQEAAPPLHSDDHYCCQEDDSFAHLHIGGQKESCDPVAATTLNSVILMLRPWWRCAPFQIWDPGPLPAAWDPTDSLSGHWEWWKWGWTCFQDPWIFPVRNTASHRGLWCRARAAPAEWRPVCTGVTLSLCFGCTISKLFQSSGRPAASARPCVILHWAPWSLPHTLPSCIKMWVPCSDCRWGPKLVDWTLKSLDSSSGWSCMDRKDKSMHRIHVYSFENEWMPLQDGLIEWTWHQVVI